jgi:hypothetical protein
MDEYLIFVSFYNNDKRATLLTFADSPEEAFDNIVKLKNIEYLHSIKRLHDLMTWDNIDAEIKPLRDLRSMMPKGMNMKIEWAHE